MQVSVSVNVVDSANLRPCFAQFFEPFGWPSCFLSCEFERPFFSGHEGQSEGSHLEQVLSAILLSIDDVLDFLSDAEKGVAESVDFKAVFRLSWFDHEHSWNWERHSR